MKLNTGILPGSAKGGTARQSFRLRSAPGANGKLIPRKLDALDLEKCEGILGHYHVQTDKTDPGPALLYTDPAKMTWGAFRTLKPPMPSQHDIFGDKVELPKV